MPNSVPSQNATTTYVNGSSALDIFHRVFDLGGQLSYATDTELENGILMRDAEAFASAPVLQIATGQRAIVVAAGPIAVDAPVFRAVNGRVSAAGSSRFGRARTAAAAAGDHIEVVVEESTAAVASLAANLMELQGTYDPATNIPALTDGTGGEGFYYEVNPVPGMQYFRDFGSGNLNFAADTSGTLIHNGTVWELFPAATAGGGGGPGVTDLGIANRDATDLEITSSTGLDATIPAATTLLSGLLTAADKVLIDTIPVDTNTNITTGTVAPATGNRTISFGNNNLVLTGTGLFSVDVTPGSAIDILTSGQIVLTDGAAQGVVISTATLNAELAEIGQRKAKFVDGATDSVKLQSPLPLPSGSYDVEFWDSLPTAPQVSADENFVRISDAGKLSFSASAPPAGPVTIFASVADKASRPSVTTTGYRAYVATNGLTYLWDGATWIVDSLAVEVTNAQWALLSELEEGQLAYVAEQQIWFRWTSGNGWQQTAAAYPAV